MHSLLTCALAALLLVCCSAGAQPDETNATHSLGWLRGDGSLAGSRCSVPRAATLTAAAFTAHYRHDSPVVVRVAAQSDTFLAQLSRSALLSTHGDAELLLSSAETASYDKRRAKLRDYIAGFPVSAPKQRDASAEPPPFVLFGDNVDTFAGLTASYKQPPLAGAFGRVALSFGVAPPGSGVPFHTHGPTWAEALVGRKRWLLYPPEERPPFDGGASTLSWLRRWQGGDRAIAAHGPPLDCTLGPGEALYLPSGWWHATLNVDEAVFLSSFVDDRGGGADGELR